MGYYNEQDILYGSGRRVAPQPTRRAELHVDRTSPTCIRYTLVEAGRVIWTNRVEPSERGHAGARGRMAAWALKHGVTVRQAQPARVPVAVASTR
jgi:hypothetical protein